MFETCVAGGVCRLSAPGSRWLATGWDGGYHTGSSAVNVSVPTGFERTDLDAYVGERLAEAGFERDGPVLLTGVDIEHARAARYGPVVAVATAGVSNPARLPERPGDAAGATANTGDEAASAGDGDPPIGTVNLLVGTTRALDDGRLATLLSTVVEAKTATLQARTGFTGTTTDAVAVGTTVEGDPAEFAGSGTTVGNAARVCVRDALVASLDARYAETPIPDSVADADHGVVTAGTADVFRP